MSTQQFDPIRYRAGQRQEWNTAASGWQNRWQEIEPPLQSVSDRMMELADIQPGQRVLDVATGIGEPAVTAARRVGPSGRVTAIDLSPQMLAFGRTRATELGLHNIDFREMDAEALDLPEHSFDIILSRFGLMFLPALDAALKSMLKLLLPGGRLVAAVWGPPQKVPFARLPMEVMMRELQLPPPPPGMPGPFRLGDANYVEQLLTQAGFTQIHIEPMMLTLEWDSVEEYVHFQRDIVAQINMILARYPVERQAEILQAIKEAARPYITPSGIFHTENVLLLVVGRRISL